MCTLDVPMDSCWLLRSRWGSFSLSGNNALFQNRDRQNSLVVVKVQWKRQWSAAERWKCVLHLPLHLEGLLDSHTSECYSFGCVLERFVQMLMQALVTFHFSSVLLPFYPGWQEHNHVCVTVYFFCVCTTVGSVSVAMCIWNRRNESVTNKYYNQCICCELFAYCRKFSQYGAITRPQLCSVSTKVKVLTLL